eukprot:Nk52_evm14s2578 gene=Nk52_evmTU14s2578
MTQRKKKQDSLPFYKPVRETAAEIIENARASLKNPSRPFTPSDKTRSLTTGIGSSSSGSSSKSSSSLLKKSTDATIELIQNINVNSHSVLKPIGSTEESYKDIKNGDSKPVNAPRPPPKKTNSNSYRRRNPASSSSPSASSSLTKTDTSHAAKNPIVTTVGAGVSPQIDWERVNHTLTRLSNTDTGDLNCHNLLDELQTIFGNTKGIEVEYVRPVITQCARFIECESSAVTVIKACKLIITLNGYESSAFEALYKLSRKESADQAFASEKIWNFLIPRVDSLSFSGHIEKEFDYVCTILKNLSNNEEFQQAFAKNGLVESYAHFFESVNDRGDKGENEEEGLIRAMTQVTGCLRNLAVNSAHRKYVLEANLIPLSLPLLNRFRRYVEIVLNFSRIFSKLSLQRDCLDQMIKASNFASLLLDVLSFHPSHNPLAMRIFFILGNMTAIDQQTRSNIFSSLSGLSCLCENISELTEKVCNSASDRESGEEEKTLVKAIRVFANICINENIGSSLCKHPCVEALVILLENLPIDEHEELILNVVATFNNLSYYNIEGNIAVDNRIVVSKVIIPLLLHVNVEAVIETVRVFGNFTRFDNVKILMHELKADVAMVVLLSHSDRDVVYSACGVLINLMANKCHREVFFKNDGVGALVTIMDQLGISDIPILSLACKILCNYGCDNNNSAQYFGGEDCDALIDILTDTLNQPFDGISEQYQSQLQADVLPAAKHLLDNIRKHYTHLVALEYVDATD